METEVFFQFKLSLLALSALFGYMCYAYIAIIIFFMIPVRGPTLDVRI